MRGSLARAIFSTRSSKATLAVLSSVAMGSAGAYSSRLPATLVALSTLMRRVWPAAAMVRTVRAASSSEASDRSSE